MWGIWFPSSVAESCTHLNMIPILMGLRSTDCHTLKYFDDDSGDPCFVYSLFHPFLIHNSMSPRHPPVLTLLRQWQVYDLFQCLLAICFILPRKTVMSCENGALDVFILSFYSPERIILAARISWNFLVSGFVSRCSDLCDLLALVEALIRTQITLCLTVKSFIAKAKQSHLVCLNNTQNTAGYIVHTSLLNECRIS